MLIATGFELDTATNNLVVTGVSATGALHPISRELLHRQGLPDVTGRTRRERISIDFKYWSKVSLREYLTPLGIELPELINLRHQCFAFELNTKTYLLPALAVMRGVFFPANVLLPTMFLPNALELACNFGLQDEYLTAELEPSWLRRNGAYRAAHLPGLLTWLYAYPSALKAASSLHANAVRGIIGMELPQALVTVVLHSVVVGDRQLVTKVTLVEVHPTEEPHFALEQELNAISLHSKQQGQNATNPYLSNQFDVPLHSDGSFYLTETEWGSIRNLVVTKKQPTHDLRLLLDGVFEKLVTKQPWKSIEYKSGSWVNASALLHAWSQDGRFQKLLSELGRLRSTTTSESNLV